MKTLDRSVETLSHEQKLFNLPSKLFKLPSKLFKLPSKLFKLPSKLFKPKWHQTIYIGKFPRILKNRKRKSRMGGTVKADGGSCKLYLLSL